MYWLSESFHTLFESSRAEGERRPSDSKAEVPLAGPVAHCRADVVVVGSGYGGAVAAEALALQLRGRRDAQGRPLQVLVLERGKEMLPGEFPEDVSELPSQVRINSTSQSLDAGYAGSLFQIFPADERSDSSVSVVVGTALGGGSQINAGVARRPHPSVFDHPRWPRRLRGQGLSLLDRHFTAVQQGLAAAPLPGHLAPRKLRALEVLRDQLYQPGGLPEGYQARFERPPIAVNFETFPEGRNASGVLQPPCNLCGNCSSGCNTGAKNTLTTNYLPRARAAGARIITEALVVRLEQDASSGLHTLEVRPTASIDAADQDRRLFIEARIVVLAAGALGSTEILLRSEALRDRLSDRLGHCFSTNGDSISARYKGPQRVNSIGVGLAAQDQPAAELPGPTITAALLLEPDGRRVQADGLAEPTYTVEDCAIPLALADVAGELVTSAAMLRTMTQRVTPLPEDAQVDPLSHDPKAIAHTAFYLSMARDTAAGRIVLAEPARKDGIAHARVFWPSDNPPAREVPHQSATLQRLDDMLTGPSYLGGTYVPNPAREPVPRALAKVMSHMPQGSSLTVHPLGGCPMGDDASQGVVDDRGRVFDRNAGHVISGLYVLDGAIVPCAVETNPFLTIAALAHRGVEQMIALDLPTLLPEQVQQAAPAPQAPPHLPPQPQIRRAPLRAEPTRFEFSERLRQKLARRDGLEDLFDLAGLPDQEFADGRIYLELTLSYSPDDLDAFLTHPDHHSSLQGSMRIVRRRLRFPAFADGDWEVVSAEHRILSGSIHLFRMVEPPSPGTAARAFSTYHKRRLQRESALSGKSILRDAFDADKGPPASQFAEQAAFMAHIGSRREVAYDLITLDDKGNSHHWRGAKDISYRPDSNVWRDLFQLPLHRVDKGLTRWSGLLSVDVDYFLSAGVPSVLSQQSLPHAALALTRYVMFYLRVILDTYFYEFGPPDYPEIAQTGMPLPGPLAVAGTTVSPLGYWLPVAEFGRIVRSPVPPGQSPRQRGQQFEALLRELSPREGAPTSLAHNLVSVYETPADTCKGAVALFHGYAISSSMWASPHIGRNMVQSLLAAGYDVYVADLRSSSALDDIRNQAVSFDAVAEEDIACTLEFVWQQHGRRHGSHKHRIHLVAHCMGSAQTAMALLSQQQSCDEDSHWAPARAAFEMSRTRIGKASFFQVAPLMAVTRANAVRGRAAAVLDALVRRQTVGPWLNGSDRVSTLEALLDRLAMTFPYHPERDPGSPLDREKSPWVGVTRKAFWLYGETWDNANLGEAVMRNIHEIIGPVNLATYRQVGAFVRCGRVVNGVGANDYVKDEYLAEAFGSFESLWLHGERSGMFERQTTEGTVQRLRRLLAPSGLQERVSFQSLPGFGHLDSLIGEQAHAQGNGHDHVLRFLDRPPVLAQGSIAPATHIEVLRGVSTGPFHSLTPQKRLRLWFFAQGEESERLVGGWVGIAVQQEGQWRWRKAWRLKVSRTFAALHQYAHEFARDQLLAHERIVCAAIFETAHAAPQPTSGAQQAGATSGRPSARAVAADDSQCSDDAQLIDAAQLQAWDRFLGPLMDSGSSLNPMPPVDPSAPLRSFLLGSCQYPGWMMDRQYARRAHQAWLEHFEEHLPRDEALVLTGDQVYLDAMGNLLGDNPRVDILARAYVEAFGGHSSDQSAWQQLLRQISLHCMMDDHEFVDNFSQSSSMPALSREMAFRAFALFQGPSLPDYRIGAGTGACGLSMPDAHFSGASSLCGAPCFYLDVRYHRNRKKGQLFSEDEFRAFEDWARSVDRLAPKFLITGSVLMPVLLSTLVQPAAALDDDTINGFPEQRDRIIDVLLRERLQNMVFLSGDLHLSCFGQGALRSARGDLPFGFCVSSGLYAPMPFANTRSWQLPETGRDHHLRMHGSRLDSLRFRIEAVTEVQSLARILIDRSGPAARVHCELLDSEGRTALQGLLTAPCA